METLLETWTPTPCKAPAFSSQGGCTGRAPSVLPAGLRWGCEPWGPPELDVTSSRGPSRAMDLLCLPCSLHLPLPPPCAGSGPIVCPKEGVRSQGNCCKGWGDQTPYSRCLPQCPQDRDPSMRPPHSRSLLELGPVSVPLRHGQSCGVSRAGTPLCAPRHTWSVTVSLSAWSPHHKRVLQCPRGGRDPTVSPQLTRGSPGQGPFSFPSKPGGSSTLQLPPNPGIRGRMRGVQPQTPH